MVLVVNWFQIMFLFLVRQPPYVSYQYSSRCELISNYVLIFGSTTHDRFIPRKCSCELISNYVLIFGSTTTIPITKSIIKLWIDFKLCSYFWFDNQSRGASVLQLVVNWFQIMFLFLVRQLGHKRSAFGKSCELISNYVLIFGSTTILNGLQAVAALWIDFKLCSYFWFDNVRGTDPLFLKVVNWFQIMFLFLVRQPLAFIVNFDDSCELISNYVLIFGSTTSLSPAEHSVCCELISNYVLIFGSTTKIFVTSAVWKLWIDFKLCSYFWFDNHRHFICLPQSVVNWFQIMFLFLVRQQRCLGFSGPFRCELISNYVLIFGSTTNFFSQIVVYLLWIDFKLCSYFWFDNSWWECRC